MTSDIRASKWAAQCNQALAIESLTRKVDNKDTSAPENGAVEGEEHNVAVQDTSTSNSAEFARAFKDAGITINPKIENQKLGAAKVITSNHPTNPVQLGGLCKHQLSNISSYVGPSDVECPAPVRVVSQKQNNSAEHPAEKLKKAWGSVDKQVASSWEYGRLSSMSSDESIIEFEDGSSVSGPKLNIKPQISFRISSKKPGLSKWGKKAHLLQLKEPQSTQTNSYALEVDLFEKELRESMSSVHNESAATETAAAVDLLGGELEEINTSLITPFTAKSERESCLSMFNSEATSFKPEDTSATEPKLQQSRPSDAPSKIKIQKVPEETDAVTIPDDPIIIGAIPYFIVAVNHGGRLLFRIVASASSKHSAPYTGSLNHIVPFPGVDLTNGAITKQLIETLGVTDLTAMNPNEMV